MLDLITFCADKTFHDPLAISRRQTVCGTFHTVSIHLDVILAYAASTNLRLETARCNARIKSRCDIRAGDVPKEPSKNSGRRNHVPNR